MRQLGQLPKPNKKKPVDNEVRSIYESFVSENEIEIMGKSVPTRKISNFSHDEYFAKKGVSLTKSKTPERITPIQQKKNLTSVYTLQPLKVVTHSF